jgi:hypothetical protein
MTPADTADIQALRGYRPQIDPGIGYTFGRARQALKNQFNNPLGADAPAAVRDAAYAAGEGDIAQQEAQAYRGAYNDVNQQDYQRLAALAQMTRPELVGLGSTTSSSGKTTGTTTGSSSGYSSGQSYGTGIESQNALSGILGGAANVGLAFA